MGQVLVMLDLILPQWLTGHNGVEAMEYNHAGLDAYAAAGRHPGSPG